MRKWGIVYVLTYIAVVIGFFFLFKFTNHVFPNQPVNLRWMILPDVLFGLLLLYGYGVRSSSEKNKLLERETLQHLLERDEKRNERRKQAEDELDGKIVEALKIMNSSPKSYSNEDEANHELFLLLKRDMPDVDIRYQPKISGTRTADLTIGNTIIEGKLDLLHQTEADRLVGQLEDYCSDEKYKVKIVVYGEIKPEFYQRIQARIDRLYFGRVALILLPSPTRKRREGNQAFSRE